MLSASVIAIIVRYGFVMERLNCLLLVVILLITFDAQAKTASEIFEAVSNKVIVIQTYDKMGKELGFGSGVVLPDGVVATNAHVIEGATLLKVLHQKKYYEASLLYIDGGRDVCTLKVKGFKVPPVILGTSNHLRVGSRIYAIGAPKGLILTMSEGIISSLRPVEGGQYIQITAPISPGSSGGGLFDEKGKLIGLTTDM